MLLRSLRLLLGPVYVLAGALHFLRPQVYESIIPPELPAHRELVYASGVAEMAGGFAVLHPRTRRLGGIWLALVLVGVFPANLHMALRADQYPQIPATLLWLRLPLQGLLVWWALAATREG